jgi:hypothetical protein
VGLRRGKGDFEVCCYPNTFVLEDPGFLADTRGRFEEVFADDASFSIRPNQPGSMDLATCFVAIEVVDGDFLGVLVATNHLTA